MFAGPLKDYPLFIQPARAYSATPNKDSSFIFAVFLSSIMCLLSYSFVYWLIAVRFSHFFFIFHLNFISLFRGTSSIGFHHFNEQLLHNEVVGRNTWGESLVNGLEELINSSRKENGISGIITFVISAYLFLTAIWSGWVTY